MAHPGACHVGRGSGENLVTIGVVFFVSFWSSSFLSPSHACLLLSSFPSGARLLLPFLLPCPSGPQSPTTTVREQRRRPDPWRRPTPPSGCDAGSLHLTGLALPSTLRRQRYGGPGSGKHRGVVWPAGALWTARRGTAAAPGHVFWPRQAVDLSCCLHFVSSMF